MTEALSLNNLQLLFLERFLLEFLDDYVSCQVHASRIFGLPASYL